MPKIVEKKWNKIFHSYPCLIMDEVQLYSYMATATSFFFWVWYIHPFNTGAAIMNAFGVYLEFGYLCFYLNEQKFGLKVAAIFFGTMYFYVVAMMLVTLHYLIKIAGGSLLGGIICGVLGGIVYTSPLFLLAQLCFFIQVFNLLVTFLCLEGLPVLLSLVAFLNGVTWSVYAFLKTIKPQTGNEIGKYFGLIQFIVYVYVSLYGVTPEKNRKKTSELELQKVAA